MGRWLDGYKQYIAKLNSTIKQRSFKYKEQGKYIISPLYWDTWDFIVDARLKGIYHGMTLSLALDVVLCLNDGDEFEDVKNVVMGQHQHSYNSMWEMLHDVAWLCHRGKKFYRYMIEHVAI